MTPEINRKLPKLAKKVTFMSHSGPPFRDMGIYKMSTTFFYCVNTTKGNYFHLPEYQRKHSESTLHIKPRYVSLSSTMCF